MLQTELVADAHLLDVFGALLFLLCSLLHDRGKCSSILNTGSVVMANEVHRQLTGLYWLSSVRSGLPLTLGSGAPMLKLLESCETPPLFKHVTMETYSDQMFTTILRLHQNYVIISCAHGLFFLFCVETSSDEIFINWNLLQIRTVIHHNSLNTLTSRPLYPKGFNLVLVWEEDSLATVKMKLKTFLYENA